MFASTAAQKRKRLPRHHREFDRAAVSKTAATAFDDPFALVIDDRKHSDDEHREKLLGLFRQKRARRY